MDLSESKDFLVHTASLKEVRVFSREVFEKLKINNDLKEELVAKLNEVLYDFVTFLEHSSQILSKSSFIFNNYI